MEFKVNSSIPIRFEKVSESEDNRFTFVRIEVAHEGKNLNNSYFSKEVLEKMGQSIGNIPIVGYIKKDSEGNDDFSGHEMKITITEDGIDYTYLGKAYGLVPKECNYRFELKTLDTGEQKNYLIVDGILWNKFEDCIKIFEEDGFRWQSMELLPESIHGQFSEDKCFHFSEATVEALCILGRNVNPAMAGATVSTYSLSTIKDQLREMLNELKKSNIINGENSIQTSAFSIDEDNHQNIQKESKEDEILTDVAKTKQQIAEQFSLTSNQLYNELYNKVAELKYKGKNWYGEEVEYSKYYMNDFDESYVYAVDRQNNYQDVKMSYSKDGDDVSIDFESASRIKWSPVDWEDGAEEIEMENFTLKILEEIKKDFDKAIENKNEISAKLDKQATSLVELNDKYSKLESTLAEKDVQISAKEQELESLKEFKSQIEENERHSKVEKLFEKYKKTLTKEDVDTFREKESTFAQYEEFEKEVKLFVADKIAEEISSQTSTNVTQFTQMGLNQNKQENLSKSKSYWDRLEESNK